LKISVKWLNDYIDIKDKNPLDVLEQLTVSGLEVDEVEDKAGALKNIVVGYVKEKKKHPNADKLSLCVVTDGEKDYNVVCGAPNVEAGQKIAFAKIGAIIPMNGMEMKKTKIRGEVSEGMICAEDELGLGNDHSGIMVLDENLEPGTPIAKVFNIDDVVAEIDITPNRADALSHIGMARDLAASYKTVVKYPELNFNDVGEDINNFAKIEIVDSEGCPRYTATVVTGVKVKESPDWLKEKLLAVGLRSINNVVDITNFIMYELGQPLHAFDLDKLAGRKIIVRKAGSEQKFVTLDSKEREMAADDLMICDAEKPVAIAGIMGGENSEVSENTVNVLIESAYFNPSRIRKTSKRLGLSTDSSYRFERGCNPEGTLFATQRAAQLIAELGGGTIAKGVIDVYPNPLKRKNVKLRYNRITKILGFEIPKDEVKGILIGLGFVILEENENSLGVEVPLFRHDIEREIDLIEEVARIFGYNNIPLIEKINVPMKERIDQSAYRDEVRNILTGLGYYEILNNSMLNKERAEEFGKAIPVLSPQSMEMSNLRTSLIPGLLMTISRNLKVRESNLKLFEIGHIFIGKNDVIDSFDDFVEEEHLVLAVTGKKNEDSWYQKEREFDIFDIKGDVESFLNKLNIKRSDKESYILDYDAHFEYRIVKEFKKNVFCTGGKLSKELLNKYDINQDVFIFDFNMGIVKEFPKNIKKYKPVLRFPKVIRDFALVLDKSVNYKEVIKSIRQGSSNLLKNITLFDIFESESLGEGKKSMAFQLEYYDEKRTLTEEEVEKDFWNAIENVKKNLKAKLRG